MSQKSSLPQLAKSVSMALIPDTRAYNEIITSWSAIESAATAAPKLKQGSLFA